MPVSADNKLTARAYPVRNHPDVVEVVITRPDGAIEYERGHYLVTARSDVKAWSRRVCIPVAFAPGFPA